MSEYKEWDDEGDDIAASGDLQKGEDDYSEDDKDLVKTLNTAASLGLDSTINGLDSSGLVNSMNNNEAFIKKEIDAGYGIANSMRDMEGRPITETQRIISQLPNNKDDTE